MCALLIEAGAPLDAVDKTNNTPLHEAARFNHPEVVRNLVKAGAGLERPAYEGRTPLCQAALYGSKDALETLIDVGADVNARIEHDTSRSESGKKLGYLKLDIGVVVETKFHGTTALHLAAQAGRNCSTPNRPDHLGCAERMAKAGVEDGAVHHRAHEMRATERQHHLQEQLNQAPSAAPHTSSPSTPSMVIGGAVWNAHEEVQEQSVAVQQVPRQRMRL